MTLKIFLLSICISCLAITAANCQTQNNTEENTQVTTSQGRNGQEKKGPRSDRQRRTPAQIIAKLDANNDGSVSRIEAKGPIKKRFEKIDTNNNGFISLRELKAAPRPKRKGARGNRTNQEQ